MDKSGLIVVYIVVLAVFICLSFFFSSSDMAYGSTDISRFERAINENPKKKSYKIGYKLEKNYDSTISTILLLNDTINAGLDSISTLLGVNICLMIYGEAANISGLADNWGFVASLICLVIKIIFGEIIAKSIGKIYNFKLASLYSYIINACNYIFFPITFLVSNFGKGVTYPITHNIKDSAINEDDLHEMVDDIEAQGSVDEEKANLLHDAITYTNTEAFEIMTPRVDIVAIDYDDDIETIFKDERIFKYTRVPVYQGTIDNVIGYIKTRDLMIAKLNDDKIILHDLLQEAIRFPRSTEINDILKEFKKKKQHFALVIDEYGGLEGILTMEDILEEIVGDIWDEKDDPDSSFSERKDGSYIVSGNLNLEDFCKLFDLDFDEIDTEYITIGGFCIELLDDKFAKVGDVVEYKFIKMKVIAVDKNGAIEKLHVFVDKKKKEEEESHFIDKIINIDEK